MKKFIVWGLLSVCCSVSFAQDPTAQKYAAFINPAEGYKHLSILASDAFEGRETGTPGAKKAANYIAGEFKKLGLQAPVKGSYFQKVPLIESSVKVNRFIVNGSALKNYSDFYIPGSPLSKSIKTQEIVIVGPGSGADDDLNTFNIAGKTILFLNTGAKRIQYIRSKNPALMIATSPAIADVLQRLGGKPPRANMRIKPDMSKQSEAAKQAPLIYMTTEAAASVLKSSGHDISELNVAATIPQAIKAAVNLRFHLDIKDISAVNVLGFMEGTDLKDEILVFSAHYDHIGLNPNSPDKVNNGADDDGSGTTGILEIATAFSNAKKDGKGPRRSILFLGNVGEEKGLLGSEWYSDNPVFPLSKTITDLNIDMIGRIDPPHAADTNYCYLIGSDKLSTDLHKISEQANATYTKLKLDYKYNAPNDPERIYYRSDHYNFAKHNIPIIFYFNGVHEDYHQPGDEVSKINFGMLTKRAQLVFYTGWELANRDKKPVVDLVSDLPNNR